jgi:signal transduction histidine kinase
LKTLGSSVDHQVAGQSAHILSPNGADGSANALNQHDRITSDGSLFEWGPPSDVLELTRADIFEKLLSLRDDERQRIGQELHDSAGQLLFSLQLSVARLRQTQEDGEHESLIEEIHDTARLIGQEIRSLAFLNHPARMDPRGLVAALDALFHGFGKRTGCRAEFKLIGDQPMVNGASCMALLRVAQEALVNIHRHAHASSVAAKLQRRKATLELTITDNGVGLPPPEQRAMNGGVGLDGMRFRVERLGGHFSIENLEQGTRLLASVPLGT